MDGLIKSIFSEYGLIAVLFTILIFGIIKVFSKLMSYIPDAVKEHFKQIREMQDKFSSDLDKIVQKHTEANNKIVEEFKKELHSLSAEHEAQIKMLSAIDTKLDKALNQ